MHNSWAIYWISKRFLSALKLRFMSVFVWKSTSFLCLLRRNVIVHAFVGLVCVYASAYACVHLSSLLRSRLCLWFGFCICVSVYICVCRWDFVFCVVFVFAFAFAFALAFGFAFTPAFPFVFAFAFAFVFVSVCLCLYLVCVCVSLFFVCVSVYVYSYWSFSVKIFYKSSFLANWWQWDMFHLINIWTTSMPIFIPIDSLQTF